MHRNIVHKIKVLRENKRISQLEMADRLHVDLSTYKRIEKPTSTTWAKYLDDILINLDISQEEFFKDLSSKVNINNNNGSFGSYHLTIEAVLTENREKSKKIEELYETLLQTQKEIALEKDKHLAKFDRLLDKLENINLKTQ